MAVWMKAPKGAEYAGGISVKVLYAAVRSGSLKAAKIGAGRNLLFCEEFLDEWLRGTVTQSAERDQ